MLGMERGRRPFKAGELPDGVLLIARFALGGAEIRRDLVRTRSFLALVGHRARHPRSHHALAVAKNFFASKGFSRKST
jgi:hypothetical protein